MEKALADELGAEKKGALIAIADMQGASFGTAFRINDTWRLNASLDAKWSGEVSGEVKVVASW